MRADHLKAADDAAEYNTIYTNKQNKLSKQSTYQQQQIEIKNTKIHKQNTF